MDLLSHALVGGLVASVGLQEEYGPIASATMVAASMIPDLDSALMILGPRYFYQYHRHPLTHSLGGAVLLSGAITAVVCLATSLKRPWLVFGISLGGIVLHLLCDLITPWPIPFLFPFSAKTYSLDLIHFLDPFLLVVLGASLLSVRRWPERGTLVIALVMLAVVTYLGFRAYGRQTALHLVSDRASAGRGAVPSTSSGQALPHGASLVAWDVIEQEGEGYSCYVVDVLWGEVRSSHVIRSANDERITTISSNSPLVQAFLKRARFPVASVTEEGDRTIIEWGDVHLMISGGFLRGVKVVLDRQGNVIEEGFELRARD